ncbi:MAG: aspartate--tRNA ligase [Bacilli bacterium]|nr:aspartate--tRNA ligase [Bacilli bacterium]
MERTCFNTDLSEKDVGKKVTLLGWVSKRRNFGSILFIDLRDRSGIIQIMVQDADKVPDVRNEYVIEVNGTVALREQPNNKIKTGKIEVIAESIKVVNTAKLTPLIIADETDALEETRLKYRYLDLRRPCMQKYFDIRDAIKITTHRYLHEHRFIEVETPMLCASSPEGAKEYLVPSRLHHGSFYALPQSPQMFKQLLMVGGFERYYQIARCFRDEDLRAPMLCASSPEGAKEYLVPSRLHHGSFYALPQSPQMFKQLLMVGGFERYYQIARCFRDEDLRADRQPDFTQIDIETSFLDQQQFLEMMEGLIHEIFMNTIGYDVKLPLRQMTYKEAMERFGSDKPDTRFGIELHDLKGVFADTTFEAYKTAEAIKGICVPGVAEITSRKVIDSLTIEAKKYGLGGITVIKRENGELTGSFVKFLSENEKAALVKELGVGNNDIIIIAAGPYNRVAPLLGALRCQYARELGLIQPNTYDLLWVVDFPMFERDIENGQIVATHHPFTRPKDEDLKYLEEGEDPTKMISSAYDIVINGYEAGGGTLRIYDQDVQKKIFRTLGLTDEEVKEKFGYFVEALQYGTPPHAGMAFGLDRLAMILGGTDNIRDVIAFPKNLAGVCPMSGAPTRVTQQQLDDLGITFQEEEK